ncbi:hypothetical protein LZP73_14725 [Shewanella sp. AS16]|uniref:hypothetical protein n=1 Tax=Shewanella sp. AS16 TaxID=2907625 RepID=UPI001F3D495C|nr:hypothetical protein [Shewanella sp. AS16]MCE9687441.1 hypothetical protein [Shewanella sp. AS16]
MDADSKRGIRAYIDKINVTKVKERVSITGGDGYILKDFTCNLLEQLVVTPVNDSVYYFDMFDCPMPNKLISLKSNKRQATLLKNAEWSLNNGDFGTAALAYTEAAYRLSSLDKNRQESINLEVNAYNAAGRYLSVVDSTVFDKQQNKLVMSPQLKEAILGLKNEKGLKATGALDFQTLSTMSSKTLSEILFIAPKQN